MRIVVAVTSVRTRATLSPKAARSLFAAAARAARRTGSAVSLSVAFVDETESRRLNRTFRGTRKVANVFSVSLGSEDGRRTAQHGEIVLCPTAIAREARRAGLSVREHTARLFIHGALHLLGYDHRTDAEERVMERIAARAFTSH